jgi:hypothetical protein
MTPREAFRSGARPDRRGIPHSPMFKNAAGIWEEVEPKGYLGL